MIVVMIMMMVMSVAAKSHNVLVKHLKFTSSHEDFELKKLLISELVLLGQDPSVLPVSSMFIALHCRKLKFLKMALFH